METLQDRLDKFLKASGITMQYFEQQCNIAQGLGKKLSEKSYATTFKRIADGFPQLSIAWLKTGEGEMLQPIPNINMTRHNSPGDNDVFGNIVKAGKEPSSLGIGQSDGGGSEINYLKALLQEKERVIEQKDKLLSEKDQRISELKERLLELKSM